MITGANTNIRHRGLLFHVQTEDSGRAKPHIISHVYHGGTIVASLKREYADLVESPELAGEVKRLIEEQHKAMLKQLRRGEFDDAIEERLGGLPKGATTAPDIDVPQVPVDRDVASPSGDTTGSASTAGGITGASTKPATDPAPIQFEQPRAPTERVPPPEAAAAAEGAAGFGESPDSQKPLDEVILEYLVDKARERSDPRPPRKSRKKE